MDPNTQRLLFGAAGAAGGDSKTYIEDLFSTYVYQGTGSSQTITNGIDLAGKGGLIWIKNRSSTDYHLLDDTVRGAGKFLWTNTGDAQQSYGLSSFSSTGFSTGSTADQNRSNNNYVSWTFRKAAKFFDVVTAVADGNGRVTFNHSLGVKPGCVFVKRTDGVSTWWVHHRSLGEDSNLRLNSTNSVDTSYPQIFLPDSTNFVFTLGVSGATYVAYLFAHDTTADGMIQCGSFTTNGSGNATVSLGWEPQWLLVKKASTAAGDTTDDWFLYDTMRGASLSDQKKLASNTSGAESSNSSLRGVSSTGFNWSGSASATYIYIAIRRGPMKTPTSGASVFSAVTATGSTSTFRNVGFPLDMTWATSRGGDAWRVQDRIRGLPTSANSGNILLTTATNAEASIQPSIYNADNLGYYDGSSLATLSGIWHHFRRAPGFFDVVAYTETANPGTYSHSLGVTPEMIIVKRRDIASQWGVYHKDINTGITGGWPALNQNNAWYFTAALFGTSPTASVFTVDYQRSASSQTHIAYLFASCPGVSKVGSYTGTGTTLQINCGFTNGARFVLIKRVDAVGDWYVWDTARGIVAANEPYLLLNSSAAEVTNTDYIDPYAAGFEISSTAPAAINASGGSFIYLAIS